MLEMEARFRSLREDAKETQMTTAWRLLQRSLTALLFTTAIVDRTAPLRAGPPIVLDRNLGDFTEGGTVKLFFTTLSGEAPITWGNLTVSGPDAPAIVPSTCFPC
jgi:hypothetical protein